MRARDRITLTTLIAARDFLDEYGHRVPGVLASDLPRRLADIITLTNAHVTAYEAHRLHADTLVRTQEVLRAALHDDHMTPIVRIARADVRHGDELRMLRMPAGRTTIDQLASAASAMAGIAARFTDTFVSSGMRVTFVEDLRAAIRALLDARAQCTRERSAQHAATLGIASAISQGRKVLHALDDLVATELHRDAALLTNWQTVIAERRLGRPRRRRGKRPPPED